MNSYFVSFAHDDGFGNIEIKFKGEINKFEHLDFIKKMIEDSSPELSNVVILNFIRLTEKDNNKFKEFDDR